jgi:hypothetical protein
LLIVLAFAGDSTMTIFMSFQWLTGKIKGRFRETRASRFDPEHGCAGRPCQIDRC